MFSTLLAGPGVMASVSVAAVLQTVLRILLDGVGPGDAIEAPRVHFEAGVVQAEPGADEAALSRLEQAGTAVVRWDHKNLFFGGVQAVERDPSGNLGGAGDSRRGGAAAVA